MQNGTEKPKDSLCFSCTWGALRGSMLLKDILKGIHKNPRNDNSFSKASVFICLGTIFLALK